MEKRAEAFFSILYDEEYFTSIVTFWIMDTARTLVKNKDATLDDFLSLWFRVWTDNQAFSLNWKNNSLRFFEDDHFVLQCIHLNTKFHKKLGDAFISIFQFNAFGMTTMDGANSNKHICFPKFKYNSVCKFEILASIVFKVLKKHIHNEDVWNKYVNEYKEKSEFAKRIL